MKPARSLRRCRVASRGRIRSYPAELKGPGSNIFIPNLDVKYPQRREAIRANQPNGSASIPIAARQLAWGDENTFFCCCVCCSM